MTSRRPPPRGSASNNSVPTGQTLDFPRIKKGTRILAKICPRCVYMQPTIFRLGGHMTTIFDTLDKCPRCQGQLDLFEKVKPATESGEDQSSPIAERPKKTLKRSAPAEDTSETEPAAKRSATSSKNTRVETYPWCLNCKVTAHDPAKCDKQPSETWAKSVLFEVGWSAFTKLRPQDYDAVEQRYPRTAIDVMDTLHVFSLSLGRYVEFCNRRDVILDALKNDEELNQAIFGSEDPDGTGSVFEEIYTIANKAGQAMMAKLNRAMHQLFREQVLKQFPKKGQDAALGKKDWDNEVCKRLSLQNPDKYPVLQTEFDAFVLQVQMAFECYEKIMNDTQENTLQRFGKTQEKGIGGLRMLIVPTWNFRMHFDNDSLSRGLILPEFSLWSPLSSPGEYLIPTIGDLDEELALHQILERLSMSDDPKSSDQPLEETNEEDDFAQPEDGEFVQDDEPALEGDDHTIAADEEMVDATT